MKKTVSILIVLLIVILGGLGLNCSAAKVKVIKSSVQSFIWVQPSKQPLFTKRMGKFASRESLSFMATKMPGPWDMSYIRMITPGGNEIIVFNATANDTFSASITVYNTNEDWIKYWEKLRKYITGYGYRWQEM